jgi:histidinol dehydrogenase
VITVIDRGQISEDEFIKKLKKRNQIELEDITKSVKEILENIKLNGDKAIIDYTERFDGVKLTSDSMKVTKEQIIEAYNKVDEKLVDILKKARNNIYNFHKRQLTNSWMINEKEGETVGQIIRPLEIVGIYSPGGTAAYPSSVLMNAVTARVAGVEKIVMVTPPKSDGIDPAILVAADISGVNEIYSVGGAQAIGGMAFGTETMPKVDKIVGPGNIYVNTGKRLVYGYFKIALLQGLVKFLLLQMILLMLNLLQRI